MGKVGAFFYSPLRVLTFPLRASFKKVRAAGTEATPIGSRARLAINDTLLYIRLPI